MATSCTCGYCGRGFVIAAPAGTQIEYPGCGQSVEVPVAGAAGSPPQIADRSLAERRRRWCVMAGPWAISLVLHGTFLAGLASFAVFRTIRFEGDDIPVSSLRLGDRPEPGGAAETMPPGGESIFSAAAAPSLQRSSPGEMSPLGVTDRDLADLLAGDQDSGPADLPFPEGDTRSIFGPKGGRTGRGSGAGDADRVVYVVDRSGSMAETFDFVRRELKDREIGRLKETQYFHVIFFSNGPPLENPPRKLVLATLENKRAFARFLATVVPERQTDPTLAMQRAFEVRNDRGQRPQLVYFLTDGEFDATLLDRLARWNRDRRVRINTTSFLFTGGSNLLKTIAEQHGGRHTFVSRIDLGLQHESAQ